MDTLVRGWFNKMKRFKRILYVISVCAMLCTMSGCDQVTRAVDAPNGELSASKIAKEQAGIILECLKTGDSEKLEEQFCKNISSTHDLKAEIAGAIEFIDGNIIDDGKWIGMTSGGESIDNGKITKLSIHPTMCYVKTDTGQEYRIRFYGYLVYAKDSNNVGMTHITIHSEKDDNKNFAEIGEAI